MPSRVESYHYNQGHASPSAAREPDRFNGHDPVSPSEGSAQVSDITNARVAEIYSAKNISAAAAIAAKYGVRRIYFWWVMISSLFSTNTRSNLGVTLLPEIERLEFVQQKLSAKVVEHDAAKSEELKKTSTAASRTAGTFILGTGDNEVTFKIRNVEGDGNCFFRAIAVQTGTNDEANHASVRDVIYVHCITEVGGGLVDFADLLGANGGGGKLCMCVSEEARKLGNEMAACRSRKNAKSLEREAVELEEKIRILEFAELCSKSQNADLREMASIVLNGTGQQNDVKRLVALYELLNLEQQDVPSEAANEKAALEAVLTSIAAGEPIDLNQPASAAVEYGRKYVLSQLRGKLLASQMSEIELLKGPSCLGKLQKIAKKHKLSLHWLWNTAKLEPLTLDEKKSPFIGVFRGQGNGGAIPNIPNRGEVSQFIAWVHYLSATTAADGAFGGEEELPYVAQLFGVPVVQMQKGIEGCLMHIPGPNGNVTSVASHMGDLNPRNNDGSNPILENGNLDAIVQGCKAVGLYTDEIDELTETILDGDRVKSFNEFSESELANIAATLSGAVSKLTRCCVTEMSSINLINYDNNHWMAALLEEN
ncbi:MAG: bZIP transcription factor [Puniceicoccales bacterium]|jgi:hypothetical protein|nr:bZIP transcription factor [Puniceicoccales bacterium]